MNTTSINVSIDKNSNHIINRYLDACDQFLTPFAYANIAKRTNKMGTAKIMPSNMETMSRVMTEPK